MQQEMFNTHKTISVQQLRARNVITPKNEFAMKKCYADLWHMGAIPTELYLKVQKTNYVKSVDSISNIE